MAYLVLAHEQPAQLLLLVEHLLTGNDDIAILHVDRRSSLSSSTEFQALAGRPRVHLVPEPVAVRWGHRSQVDAIHRLCTHALAIGFDHGHLISGVDWPVACRDEIADSIAAEGNRLCYLDAVEGEQAWRMQTRRLDARWLRLDPERNRLAYVACWELRRVSHWLDRLLPARPQPYGPWHKGPTWWSMPADAIGEIMDEVGKAIASGRLAGTICADEHLIPTIAATRMPERLAANRRFVDIPANRSNPRILTRDDAPAIAASDAWFARKVDLKSDDFFLALPEAARRPGDTDGSMSDMALVATKV